MLKKISFVVIGVLSLLLVACSATSSSSAFGGSRQIKAEKLKNGHVTKLGFRVPQPSWQCTQIDELSSNWVLNRMKGITKLSGGYSILYESAIEYANKNNLKPDYIYMYAPAQFSVGYINFTAFSDSKITYLQCKNPEAIKLFG